MDIEHVNIDFQSIGAGLYDMMPAKDQSIVAFGMIPKNWIDLCMKMVREKVESILGPDDIKRWPADAYSAIEYEISKAIYKRASDLGRMVV